MATKKISIAIDGFSSCGKSTLAKQLAKELNYVFIDTGAMYRAVTLYAIKNKLISDSNFKTNDLVNQLPKINISFTRNSTNTGNITWLNNQNVENEIRSMKVSNLVSKVSTIKQVRQHLVKLQQNMSKNGGVVMDGRDIGTVVMPNASLKIFLTASPEVRVKRRFLELQATNKNVTVEEVRKNLTERDLIDSTREESPLKQADDAVVLDNSNLSTDEQLNLVLSWAKKLIENT